MQVNDMRTPSLSETPGVLTGRVVSRQPISRWLSLGEYLLDSLFQIITLGIGWIIWTAFICQRGQTPAKQLLDLYIVNSYNDRVVVWWMVWARSLAPASPAIVFAILSPLVTLSSAGYLAIPMLMLQFIAFMLPIIDACWVFGSNRERLVDRVFKTAVARGDAYARA